MGSRLRRARFASASLLVTLGALGQSTAALAQDHDALDRLLARSLPDISRWVAQSSERFTDRFGGERPRALAREERDPLVAPVAPAPAGLDARWLAEGPTPSIEWSQLSTSRELTSIPLTLVLPATIDLTLDQFVDSTRESDQHLRFADVGAMFTFPLEIGLARYGHLTFSAGAHLRFFDPEMRAGNGGDATQWIGCAGFSLSF
jgi:hypothetical protein